MTEENRTLHLIRATVDARGLYSFALRAHLPTREFDEGYAIHAFFCGLFDGEASPGERVAPKPFAVRDSSRRMLDIMAYSSFTSAELGSRARAFGDPAAVQACDLDALASKPMPKAFPKGTRLGFSLRACPVRRLSNKLRGRQRTKKAEVDVFQARAWEVGEDVTLRREDVYVDWLRLELEKENASTLLSATLARGQLARLQRREHAPGRKAVPVRHPDVTFDGVLEVRDEAAFMRRLARGVGRHRAFGFGMLLLKPPPR